MNFIEKKKKNMGLVPIIPRYNVDKGNSRSTFHIFNSNEALGVWQISLFTSGSAPTPKFILTLGDNNNTNITLNFFCLRKMIKLKKKMRKFSKKMIFIFICFFFELISFIIYLLKVKVYLVFILLRI